MSDWSLRNLLLAVLHDDIEHKLKAARGSFGHPGTKGDASEAVWLELLEAYLPVRYRAAKAHIVDSLGTFSQQIDVVIFDRQYSPFIFSFQQQLIIPAESVYADCCGQAGRQMRIRLLMPKRRSRPFGGSIELVYQFRQLMGRHRPSLQRAFWAACSPSKATGLQVWVSHYWRLWR